MGVEWIYLELRLGLWVTAVGCPPTGPRLDLFHLSVEDQERLTRILDG